MEDISNKFLCINCNHKNNIFCKNKDADEYINNIISTSKQYTKGEVIFKQGAYPTGIQIIQSGKVKIVKTSDEGKEQIVRFAISGELLGYRTLLGSHVYRGNAIALNNVIICHISKKNFFTKLIESPKLYLELLGKLSNDLARAEETILSISQKTVKQRIAEAIVILYFKFGCEANGSIKIQLTRKELGNMIGTTIETTIRTLACLKKDGLIEFDGKKLIVGDIRKLMTIANFNT